MFDDNKRKKLRVTLMAAAIATLSVGQGYAAGLGKLTVLSGLGQPLRAELDISASKEELVSLAARIAPQESFRQANIEYSGVLSSLRFTLDKRAGGQPYFRVSSDRAIGEPFLDLLVELSWSSGRLVREYTFLLDPPELNKPVADVPPPVTPPVLTAPVRREVEKPVAVPAAAAPKSAEKAGDKATEKPAEKAPARAAKPGPAPVAAKPAAETQAATRTVQKGDTLGKIAAEVRPEGINLDQMLVALFRNNQEAFEGGNINRLKAGKILSVPEKEAIAAVDANEARKIVLTHSSDFDGYRRKLAGAVADSAPVKEESKQSSGGKITAKVEDKAPVAPGKDKLQVSRTEASGDTAKLKALEEDKAIKEKALKDAQGRIAELEKNVADLRKLAEMKSQAAADLQKQAAAKAALEAIKKPEAPAKPAEAVKLAEPAKAEVAAKTPAEQPAEVAKTEVKSEEEKAGIRKTDEAAKPAAVPLPAAKPTPVPVEEPSFIDENGPLVYGGAGVLALLAAYLGFNASRRKKAAAAPAAKQAFAGDAAGDDDADEGTSLLDELPSVAAKADTTASAEVEADPIREADAFMAYGRDTQAEEVLLAALAKTPENLHVHLKLLEIYSARKSIPQFNTVAQSLFAQTGGFGLEWERAVALGRALDPSNPYYGALEVVEPVAPVLPAEEPAAQLAAEEPEPSPVVPDLEPVAAPVEAEPAPALLAEPEPEAETEPASEAEPELQSAAASESLASPEEAEAHALDLDFDLTAVEAAAAAEPADVEPLAIAAAVEESESVPQATAEPADAFASLDFDLNLGEPAAATEAPAAVEPAAQAAADTDELLSIDFDLGDLAPSAPASPEREAAATAAPAGNSLDFDLGADSDASPEAAAETAPETKPETPLTAPAPLDLDFNLDLDALPAVETAAAAGKEAEEITPLDFDFDLGNTPLPSVNPDATEPPPPALGLADIDLDLPVPETPALEAAQDALPEPLPASEPAAPVEEERPEVTTKLELAQAYEEMGDLEGAKELFQEVLAEGNSTQQALAQEKLDKLG